MINQELIKTGAEKIHWVAEHMPVLNALTERYEAEKPLSGLKLAMSIHLEAKTAWLALCLKRLGAEVTCSGSNPLTTKDDVCAALREEGLIVNAKYGESMEEYDRHLEETLSILPHIVLDDGGDLLALLRKKPELAVNMRGGCEETTTGILRIQQLERAGKLPFAMIDVNGATMKHMFDNRYGTGQSVMVGIMQTTNLIVASKVVVVAGYGWCGRGVAMRTAGMGARVIVTEIEPFKAVEAIMDGFEVMPMDEAAKLGDLFITVTGCKDVIAERHFPLLKDGAILCNAGHFDVEVAVERMRQMSKSHKRVRENIEAYDLGDKTVYILCDGRLVNLAGGDGHPAEIMDLSFSVQMLSIKYLFEHDLPARLIPVPEELDKLIAETKLETLGVKIDRLTDDQYQYLYGSV